MLRRPRLPADPKAALNMTAGRDSGPTIEDRHPFPSIFVEEDAHPPVRHAWFRGYWDTMSEESPQGCGVGSYFHSADRVLANDTAVLPCGPS